MRAKVGFLTLLSVLVIATATRADDVGLVGSIAGLDRNTPSADLYLQYHGRLFVLNSGGTLDEYRWGGTSCGSRVLSDAEFAALQAAHNNKKMTIQPRSQDGQGDANCLVGFMLVEKKKLTLFP
jgi:hypothetical protein